jgi:hypothetical protein
LESAGDYFFLAGKTHNGTVQGIFRKEKKIISPTFQISGTLVILCPREREREREREQEKEKEKEKEREREQE